MRVLAIIPAYNEADSITRVARSVLDCSIQESFILDVLVIDDGSTDGTSELCRVNHIPVVTLPYNLGIGCAVQCGYRYARKFGYDIAFQFDGDGQHDVGSIRSLLEPLIHDNADFVIGSRFLGLSEYKSTGLRRVGIRWLSTMLYLLTGQKITDPTSGFRAANACTIKRFDYRYPHDYPEPESIMWLFKENFRVSEVPVLMFPRAHGRSSIHTLKSVYYMIKVSLAVLITR